MVIGKMNCDEFAMGSRMRIQRMGPFGTRWHWIVSRVVLAADRRRRLRKVRP